MSTNRLYIRFALLGLTFGSVPAAYSESELSTEQRLERLERFVQNQTRLQVELNQRLTDVQTENQTLRGKLDEQAYKLKKLSERQRDIYRDLDSRITQSPKVSTSSSGSSTAGSQIIGTPDVIADVAESTGKVVDPVASEQGDYDKLFPLVRKKRYGEAIAGYKEYLNKYPDGKNVEHAYYWLGQVYFVQNQDDLAMAAFEKLVASHPESAKTGGALLKLGELKLRKKQYQEAKALFTRVVSSYGGSTAQLAKEQLQNLRKLGH